VEVVGNITWHLDYLPASWDIFPPMLVVNITTINTEHDYVQQKVKSKQ